MSIPLFSNTTPPKKEKDATLKRRRQADKVKQNAPSRS